MDPARLPVYSILGHHGEFREAESLSDEDPHPKVTIVPSRMRKAVSADLVFHVYEVELISQVTYGKVLKHR